MCTFVANINHKTDTMKMKLKFFLIIVFVVLLFVCRFTKKVTQGDLLLQNIEALANTENKHIENFGVVIILNTPDIESSGYTLANMRFRQTIFYDLDSSFERLNPHLPANEQLHTFLLNEKK